MSKHLSNISKERKDLLKKAEAYYSEFEEAREELENSSKKLGQNILIVGAIGLGLALTYNLLFSEDDEENGKDITAKKLNYSRSSRIGSAAKSIAFPFLMGMAKNMIFPNSKTEEDSAE